MLKPRKLTLRMVRAFLKEQDGPVTSEELASGLGCSVETIKGKLYGWVQQAAGVRSVRRGQRKYRGWSYMPVEDSGEYEPPTRSVEDLEAQVEALLAEIESLRGGESHCPSDAKPVGLRPSV